MIDDEKIIDLFFERSEQAIQELDRKYGKICHNLSYHTLHPYGHSFLDRLYHCQRFISQ